jgi:hypothetical protein
MSRLSRLFLVAALALPLGIASLSTHADPAPMPPGPTEPLTIVTASGPHKFAVEVARTDAERELGLMYRKTLAPDHGMIFAFGSMQPVMMWMKNTFIPLDMIFMDQSGHVVAVLANTKPQSEEILSPWKPSYSVLEVNAGTAAKIGLKVGDQVQNELFGN